MANYEDGFTPTSAQSTSQYEDGFSPHPIQPIQASSFLQNLLSNAGGFGRGAGAAIASGAQDFSNSLLPQSLQDPTDYYKTLGANRNLATDIGQGLTSAIPLMAGGEAIIPRIGLAGVGALSALGRAAVRAATGVAQNELQGRAQVDSPSGGSDAAMAGIYGLTGALGDTLPLGAAKLIDKMYGSKLADQIIQEGNRANLFPDVGNIIGSPAGAEKWNKVVSGAGSPAKEVQERSLTNALNIQYAGIQNADKQANDLYANLTGGQDVHPAISQDIQNNYKALKKEGNSMYKAIEPDISAETISSHPNSTTEAENIINEQKENQLAGVTDPNLKSNLVLRAQNALKMSENPDGVSLDSKIKEERGLSGQAADLRAKGDNASARYYSDLADAHEKDINAHLTSENPELLNKIQDARDYWKNNVIPYDQSPVIRKVLNNNFDEEVSPLNLTNHLTNGSHDQLLSTLPQETKNKLVADMLFKKSQNALGEIDHPSVDVANSIGGVEASRLNKILPQDDPAREQLSKIYNVANTNKGVLNDVSRSTPTVSGGSSPDAMDLAHAAHSPTGIGALLKKGINTPTAGYWTKLLSNEQNPRLLQDILAGNKVNTEGVRQMTQPDTIGGSVSEILSGSPSQSITNLLSRPNYSRTPLVAVDQGIQNNQRRNKNA